MICNKCNNNICRIRTKLDIFHEEIDCMNKHDQKYYCEEMTKILKSYDVMANDVNLNIQINKCFRMDKRISK